MLIPLRDDNLIRRPAVATVTIIGLCVAVFLYQETLPGRSGEAFALGFGMIPSVLFGTNQLDPRIPTIAPWLTIFTSMFLHGGVLHIAGNMIYLWVFGRAMESALGPVRLTVFYLLCGVAAALTQAFIEADAEVPMIGASGAISGVLGGYLILFPRARVLVLFFWGLITTFNVSAKALLLWWIALQLVSIVISGPQEGGVAWFAHIGGFVAGMILVHVFRPSRPPLIPIPPTSTWYDPRKGPWGRRPGERRGPWG